MENNDERLICEKCCMPCETRYELDNQYVCSDCLLTHVEWNRDEK